MLRVLIVDDHAILRRGLRQILTDELGAVEVGEAATAEEGLTKLTARPWDVVLLDLSMPGRGGLDVLVDLKAQRPRVPVLVLSVHDEADFAVRCLRAGASGYLNKETAPAQLVGAVRKVLAGGRYVTERLAERLADDVAAPSAGAPHEALSDRELQVLRKIGAGRTVSEIAEAMHLSVKTVSTYRTRLLGKMGLSSNAQLMRYAVDHGITD